MICSAGEVNREKKHPTETMAVTYLAAATAVPGLLLPLGSWVQYVWREPSKPVREVLEVLSASGLDCKADNLVLSFRMPVLLLLFMRATVFSWHPNCFGGFAGLHWPPISNTGGRWISKMKGITSWAYCEMSLAKSLGNNFLVILVFSDSGLFYAATASSTCLSLHDTVTQLSWLGGGGEYKTNTHKNTTDLHCCCWQRLMPCMGPPKRDKNLSWGWAWFNSSYKASWQLSTTDRLLIRLSLNAKRKVIYIGFTPLASRKDPAPP